MQENKYSIKQWAKDDRPREKLLLKGAENLSNSELLAILIHNGTKEKTAVDLAKEILKLGKDNLNELGKLIRKRIDENQGHWGSQSHHHCSGAGIGRRRQASCLS